MKRRVHCEELASEPSQFLNEMPIDLLEDLRSVSRGCHLRVAHQQSITNKVRIERKRKVHGKMYDSVDSIAEFFKQRSQQMVRLRALGK
jgi:predicted HTH transcriptional regulator